MKITLSIEAFQAELIKIVYATNELEHDVQRQELIDKITTLVLSGLPFKLSELREVEIDMPGFSITALNRKGTKLLAEDNEFVMRYNFKTSMSELDQSVVSVGVQFDATLNEPLTIDLKIVPVKLLGITTV